MRYLYIQEVIKFEPGSETDFKLDVITYPLYSDDIVSVAIEHISECLNGEELFRTAYNHGSETWYEIGGAVVDSQRNAAIISDYLIPAFEPVIAEYWESGCDDDIVYSLNELDVEDAEDVKTKFS